jgi:hypothetical protein
MRNRILPIIFKMFIAIFAVGGLWAQSTEREQIDVSQRGPQVGERIPDFTLNDQHGETWTRDSIAGPNGTMLVFIRSADW